MVQRFIGQVEMLKNVELRKLPVSSLCNVASILEINEDWKKVMSNIPRDPRSEKFEAKYNSEHIKQVEDHAKATNRKAADILFEEWGTSGRIRPTLGTLKELLKKLEMFRAADEIAQMLGEGPTTRPLYGPAAAIDTSITAMLEQDTSELNVNGTTAQMKSDDNENAPKSLGNKTTVEMKSATDMIQLSTSDSLNVPDLSALDIKTQDPIKPEDTSNGYQTSLPNIDFNGSDLDTDILKDEKLIHFEYNELLKITKKFSERVIFMPDSGGGKLAGKIGSGGFGDVYVGYTLKHGHLAIKKARSSVQTENRELVMKIFNAEVRFLSQFRHKNIVPIIGISKDGPSLCLVCEYIGGGSLEHKIEEKLLTEGQRIDIMIGTAEGLKYLHGSKKADDTLDILLKSKTGDLNDSTTKKNNFVHGDVKSANILLTRDFVPKLCDFGLGKQYESTVIAYPMVGTTAYMSPEALIGTITQKIDIYSYGIVLLELLTGLKAIVRKNRCERINIKDYIEESCPTHDIGFVLDPFVQGWTKAKEIYALSNKCLLRDRQKRPTSEEICEILYKMKGS